ncbi:unnamed protein product [Closterium sp. NIES-54]
MAPRPSSVPLRVPLPAPPVSSLPEVPDPASDCARAASPTVARLLATAVTDPSFESAAAPALVAELLDFAAGSRLDYATAQVAESAAMDAEMASWKTTGTYDEEVPPSRANIVDGMWIFRVKRPSGSSPAFKARYVARGFSQRQGVDYFQTFSPTPKMTTLRVLLHVTAQRDYELHSLDFSTAFVQGSLHKEIWLRRPPGFTGTFPAGTQLSLRRRVYGLHQVPHEWHDTLRSTLAALGVFQRFGFQFSSPQPTPLSTSHTPSAPPLNEFVEPSGLYPELVSCLMYLMTCTRPDLAYPLSLLAHYVAPGRHRKVHLDAAKRVLQYVEHGVCAWRTESRATLLTYLLTDLGEQPPSPPILYVDNKAMTALCQEHRMEHRMKHIAMQYFLARELQQRGQLCLAYVATRANTADVFTKALPPVVPPCSCRLLSHQTLLWHHRHGHPSLPRLRGMHSRLLVSGLPRSLPDLPPSLAPPFLPCIEGRQRAAPHSSTFPPTTAPLQTFHMDGITQSFTLLASPLQNGIAEHRIGLVMEVARTSMIHAAAPHFLWPFAVRYAAHELNLWPHVSLPETSPTLRWTGKVGDALVFQVWCSRAFVCDTSADKLSARAIPCVFLGFPSHMPGWQFYHPTSRCVFPSQDITLDESVPFYRLFPYQSASFPPPPLFLAPGVSQVDPLPGTAPVEVAVGSGAASGAVSGGAASGGAEPAGVESEGGGSGGAEPRGAEPAGVGLEGAQPTGAESEGAASGGAEPRPLFPQQLHEWFAQRARLRSGAAGAGDTSTGDTGARGVGATRLGGAGVTARAGGTGGAAAAGPGGAHTKVTGAARTGRVGGVGAGGSGAKDPAESGAGGAGAVDPGAGGTGGGGTAWPRLQSVLGLSSSAGLTPPFLCPPLDQSQPSLQPASPLPAPSPYIEQTRGLTEHREPESGPALRARAVRNGRRVPLPRPPPVSGIHTMALRPSSVPLRVPLPPPLESCLPAVPDPESDLARVASPTVSRLLATVVTDPSFESTAASALVAELVDFAAACRLDYVTALVAESKPATSVRRGEAITGPYSSQWQASMDAEMASWKSTRTYVNAVPPSQTNIVDDMWIFRVKRPPGSPPAFKARYVARGFSQRQGVDYFQTFSPTQKMTTLWVLLHVAAQRDYELHSLDFSTAFLQGSLHEEIWLRRPPGFTGSFPAGTQWSLRRQVYGLCQAPCEWHVTLRTTLAALGFTPSTAEPSLFLCTDTSLPSFYVLVYVDDLVFATADTEALTLVKLELKKRYTCTNLGELRSYLVLQITQDRAWRTITLTQSHMVHQVLQRFSFRFSSLQPTPLSTSHSLSAPPSDESIEPSGLYPELVGCLMYLITCTRPDLAYSLSLLARYVAPGRHRKVHWDAAKRVLRYLCSTAGMGLVLGGRGPVVLTSHVDASWVVDSATQRLSQGYTFSLGSGSISWQSTRSSLVLSSSYKAEIYVGAMAAQELRWLTYLLTDLGEQPSSPPVLYVDNKAMIALCQEHRLEHKTKHIALRYFLSRELQQRGQLRLAYVATRANTADIFTKALPPGDHQRFSTVLGLVPTLPHLLTA